MTTEQIQLLENLINQEIDEYKNIEKLYADKKEILVHCKTAELYEIDSRITDTYKKIKNLSSMRKNVTKSMNMLSFSMSDIIKKLKEQDEAAAKKFEEKKAIVNELAQKIFNLEKTNYELIKHGMLVTNKTLEIFLKGIKPITKEYNQKGKNIAKDQLEMSSIVEEV